MKMKSSTLVFFLISLAIFSLANALANENSDTSIAKQSEGDKVVQPEWLGWGIRRPWGHPLPWGHPHPWGHPLPWAHPHPWGHPYPKWHIPGHGGALPPLPSHKIPPWWGHKPAPPKASGSGATNTEEQVEIAEQAESIEQDDDVYEPEWLGHRYIPRGHRPHYPRPHPGYGIYPRPRPGYGIYPRPGYGIYPHPYHPIPRYPLPGRGAHPPRPSHPYHPIPRYPLPGWGAHPPRPSHP